MSKKPHTQYDKSDSEIEEMVNRQTTKPTDTQELELGEIDGKLKKVLENGTAVYDTKKGRIVYTNDDLVTQIKQVFRDAGYTHPAIVKVVKSASQILVKEAIEQNYILKSQVLAAIPEKKKSEEHYQENAPIHELTYRRGFNSAIDQIKSALGLEEGK